MNSIANKSYPQSRISCGESFPYKKTLSSACLRPGIKPPYGKNLRGFFPDGNFSSSFLRLSHTSPCILNINYNELYQGYGRPFSPWASSPLQSVGRHSLSIKPEQLPGALIPHQQGRDKRRIVNGTTSLCRDRYLQGTFGSCSRR
jgi:hypothetical protein